MYVERDGCMLSASIELLDSVVTIRLAMFRSWIRFGSLAGLFPIYGSRLGRTQPLGR